MQVFNRNYKIGNINVERPYYPLGSIPEPEKTLDSHKPLHVENIGILALCGLLAGSSNGGAVDLSGIEMESLFVAGEGDTKKIIFYPTDKGAVNVENPDLNIGKIVDEGISIILSEEQITITGIYTRNVWVAEQARVDDARVTQLGELWCIQPSIPLRGEVTDLTNDGVTTAVWLSS